MKLKELLKHHNIVWPEGATHAVQDGDRKIKFASSSNIELDESMWFRRGSVIHVAEVFDLPLASDWDTAIVSQAHPHAELMLQYAQDAAITTEPHLLWQRFNAHQDIWKDSTGTPSWDANTLYRRKPATKRIHGVEVPDISFLPRASDNFYVPYPSNHHLYFSTHYDPSNDEDQHVVKHNLCYPFTKEGKAAAILHAKAMLGIK